MSTSEMLANSRPNYEEVMVPAIFGIWAPVLIASAKVGAGERVLDVASGTVSDS